jgi:hypothetical protein
MDTTTTTTAEKLTTGQVAQLLDTTEPRLSELVRRGRVKPPPPVISGRRAWDESHVQQAAAALNVPWPPAANAAVSG